MTKKDLGEEELKFCKAQYETAKAMMAENGRVLSTFFIRVGDTYDKEFSGKEGTYLAIPILTDDKDSLSVIVKMAAARANSDFLVSMMECWITAIDPEKFKAGDRTGERKEAVMIQAETPEGIWVSTADIERTSDGTPHVPDEMPEMAFIGKSMSGRFVGMLSTRASNKNCEFSQNMGD